jgi:hypothetical protein
MTIDGSPEVSAAAYDCGRCGSLRYISDLAADDDGG